MSKPPQRYEEQCHISIEFCILHFCFVEYYKLEGEDYNILIVN